jgi:hypothetical protein
LAAVLAAVGLYKFLAIAAWVVTEEGWRPGMMPWGFLVVITGPFVAAFLALPRFPRLGAVVLMLASGVFVAVCGLYVATTGMPESLASDLPLLVVGGPAAAVALVLAVRFLRAGSARRRTA